jgi:uncharacterized protein YbaP (TraB family)
VNGVKDMAQAWQFGNVAALEKMTLSELKEAPELYQKLLVERNHKLDPAHRNVSQTECGLLRCRGRGSPRRP